MRIKLTIAYDGRPFSGWQSQKNKESIQDHMEAALKGVAGSDIRLHGAGRTDAGVHAEAQTAHFDVPLGLTLGEANWTPALNTKLPPTIRVMHSEAVSDDFHARFSAVSKTYRYSIDPSPILLPTRYGLAWHHPRPFSYKLLQETLQHTQGHHNFEAYCAKRGTETPSTDYHRTIIKTEFTEHPPLIQISFTGEGFLYKMVRLLTGTAMKVACGQLAQDEFIRALASKPTHWHPLCAPPDGLTLVSVAY